MLGPKDPEGYYVVKIQRNDFNRIAKYLDDKCQVQEHGDIILVRVKSRKIAVKILRKVSEESQSGLPGVVEESSE